MVTLNFYKIFFSFHTCVLTFFFLAWAQIHFLDAVSFIFPSAFSILFLWHLSETLDLLFRLFLQQQKGAQTSQKPNPPCKTLNAFCSVRWEHPILCRTCLCEWVFGATSKGLWASVVVWFFFCNRLWNGSWHCFSCDIVAWIGTTGLWDSSLTSVQQHPFLLSSAKFYELDHPISEKTQCADIGNKSD